MVSVDPSRPGTVALLEQPGVADAIACYESLANAVDPALATIVSIEATDDGSGLLHIETQIRAAGGTAAFETFYAAELAAHEVARRAGGEAPFAFELVELDAGAATLAAV